MRRFVRIVGIGLWSIFSLDLLLYFLDWWGRWDWFTAMMQNHPKLAYFVHSPFVYLVLLALGFLFLRAEHLLRQPRIAAHFTNFRITPNRHTTPISAFFFSETDRKLDWECFLEVRLTNEADVLTTIESTGSYFRIRKSKWLRWKTEKLSTKHMEDLSQFTMDMTVDRFTKDHGQPFEGEKYRPLVSLVNEIRKVPLQRAIGYRGWLRFQVSQVSERELNSGSVLYDVWLVDALGLRHKVEFRRGSDKNWDYNFLIMDDPRQHRQ